MWEKVSEVLRILLLDRRMFSSIIFRVLVLVGLSLVVLPAVVDIVGLVQLIRSSALLSGCDAGVPR